MNIDGHNLFLFWAKTTHDKEHWPHAYHPLLCHMIDVAAVTLIMWEEVLPKAAKKRIARALGLPTDKVGLELVGKMVAWIAGLHDLGKASPPFALRETAQNLKRMYDGTDFSEQHLHRCKAPPPQDAPHGYVTASELPDILTGEFGFPHSLAQRIAALIGGHHGIFPRSEDLIKISDSENRRGGAVWRAVRRELAVALAGLLEVPRPVTLPQSALFDNATTMILAGLVAVADWIGSNSAYFACEIKDSRQPITINAQSYLVKAQSNAGKALDELGWLDWPVQDQARTFDTLFPKLSEYPRRDLQTTAIDLAAQLSTPGIVVIEAPMGEGKTEAAMYLADHCNVWLNQRGCYFALPTQATSNQMFSRVHEFLKSRFAGQRVLLQLLHGHAALSAEFETNLKQGATLLKLTPVYDDTGTAHQHHDDCTPGVVAAEWFTHRKRGLLAPFGVGTVDQALMAVLQTKHVFVRLFGLAHKTIIIDEVHAYDTYMSVLLERLLEWLASLGSPVILLSATLPKQRRDALRDAYLKGLGTAVSDGNTVTETRHPEDCYPRITWATAQSQGVKHIQTSTQNTRTLHLRHVSAKLPEGQRETFRLGEDLAEALQDGGCAAVICNTVQRAQEVYARLKPFFPGEADDGWPELDLLHARFLFKDRAERETRALIRFGKHDGEVIDREGHLHKVCRPKRAVLVSTQIIEQSLDLDFDLMVTDLAPVDLILQRAGRLHRHQRQPSERPPALHKPTLWLCDPEGDDSDVPDFGASKFVYDAYVLLRSWLVLQGCEYIAIPDDIEEMIEAVYDLERACPIEIDKPLQNYWREKLNAHEQKRIEEQKEAEDRWIKHPHYRGPFWCIATDLREEDTPEFHRAHQALTRLTEPSAQLVCLFGTRDRSYLDEQRTKPVDLTIEPERFLVKELLQCSLSVSSKYIALALLQTSVPKGWQGSALLRNHRLLVFDENRIAHLANLHFHLDPDLGLRMINTKGELTHA
jgi:CRISPR-associated endonuclease/helicase Cas3